MELHTTERLTRREFIAAGAAAGALALPERAKVVVVTTSAAMGPGSSPPLALVERMLEKGVTTRRVVATLRTRRYRRR